LVLWGFELMGTISYGSPMAGNFWRAIWVWVICFGVTIIVSLLTSRSQKTDEELEGLVWSLTEKKEAVERAWYKNHWVLAAIALVITIILNIIFF
ncbi:MAG: Na+/galactose cotransporter, partial [Actinobacteria bacterium]|nr:Na+/galactose cotransporter [Actinomycetota bacterium]